MLAQAFAHLCLWRVRVCDRTKQCPLPAGAGLHSSAQCHTVPHDQACLQYAVHARGGQVDATHPCRAGRQAGRPAARVRAAQRVGRNVQLAQRRQTPQAAQRMNAVASQPQHLNAGRPGHPIPAGKTTMVWGHSAPGMASRAHLGRSAGSRQCLPAPCGQVLRVCMRQRAWYATKARPLYLALLHVLGV